MKIQIYVAFCILLCGCKRYYMYNMLPEKVDVTHWIVDNSYKPIYCKGNISKLISPLPHVFSINEKYKIKNQLITYIYRNLPDPYSYDSMVNSIHYEYSYPIMENMADVYSITFFNNKNRKKFFFRYYECKLDTQFDDKGWVLTICD